MEMVPSPIFLKSTSKHIYLKKKTLHLEVLIAGFWVKFGPEIDFSSCREREKAL